jgi:hypothetical protein
MMAFPFCVVEWSKSQYNGLDYLAKGRVGMRLGWPYNPFCWHEYIKADLRIPVEDKRCPIMDSRLAEGAFNRL